MADDKDRVQQATDIVQLIGEHVSLKPKGREFLGLCPFHNDRNPSMSVVPAKQIYKCFSCGAGGDVFAFMMNYHKLSFREALEQLAQRAGITLSRHAGPADKEKRGQRERLLAANTAALEYFRNTLDKSPEGQAARQYVEKRGISPAMVMAFSLGASPDGWDGLARHVHNKGLPVADFEAAGLISPRRQGDGFYDRLRHRLIFPIFDALGRPIAFGGRKLREEDEPKYLNSPETALFHKSATLYGIHVASKPIIDSKTAVIVEGYTDVIACHQAGRANVVATLGTALTSEHAQVLARYGDRVVLVFDGDEAGMKAADRAVEVFVHGGIDVAVCVLPDGQDPADLMSTPDGLEQWDRLIAESPDAIGYLFERMKQRVDQVGTLSGRQSLSEAFAQRLAELGILRTTPIRRAMIVQQLAQLLNVSQQVVETLIKSADQKHRTHRPANDPSQSRTDVPWQVPNDGPEGGDIPNSAAQSVANAPVRGKLAGLRLAQRQLIGCLMRHADLYSREGSDGLPFDEAITPGDMADPGFSAVYELLYERLSQQEDSSMSALLAEFAQAQQPGLAALVTQCDQAVDQAIGTENDPQRLTELFDAAVAAIRQSTSEQAYEAQKQALLESVNNGSGSQQAQQAALKRLLELRKSQPSAIRIARPKT